MGKTLGSYFGDAIKHAGHSASHAAGSAVHGAGSALGGFIHMPHSTPHGPTGGIGPAVRPAPIQGPPAPARPSTFRDGAGNIRQIGSGTIIRPAVTRTPVSTPSRTVGRSGVTSSVRAAPASPANGRTAAPSASSTPLGKAKTYKGPNGEIRQTSSTFRNGTAGKASAAKGGKTGATPAAKDDPIKSLVDNIIAGMNTGVADEQRVAAEQSRGTMQQNSRLGQFYQQQVGGLRDSGHQDLGELMNQAAKLHGVSDETIAANQDWLKGLMSPSNGGTQDAETADAAQATRSDLASVNDHMAANLGNSGQRFDQFMAGQQLAGDAHTQEMQRTEQLNHAAQEREFAAKAAANNAQAPVLYQQYKSAADELGIKQQALDMANGLKAAQAQSTDNYHQGLLAIGKQNADTSLYRATHPAAKAGAKVGRYGLDAKYDAAITDVYKKVHGPQPTGIKDDPKTPDVDESKTPTTTPWRTTWNQLTDYANLTPGDAAVLATKWYPVDPAKTSPYNLRMMYANRKVPPAVQRQLITEAYGASGWKASQTKPKVGSILDPLAQLGQAH